MERCPALKVVASHSTGTGHIDTKYAAARDIEVVYVHPEDAVNITAVAEHTIGLIVALTRNYTGAFSGIERGEWERWGCAGERMLSRMSLGIVGYGRIGKAVEKLAEPMFKNVLRWDVGGGAMIPPYLCDIVTLHTPPDVQVVDREFIDGFYGYLINTARGESVDERAVVAALKSGRIKGYAADVLQGEFAEGFDLTESPIWDAWRDGWNVVLTPHIGGSTEDAWKETQEIVIDKVLGFYPG